MSVDRSQVNGGGQLKYLLARCGVLGLVESSRDKKAVLIELVEFLPCVCCNSEFAHCLCIKYTTFLATRNVIERPRPGRLE